MPHSLVLNLLPLSPISPQYLSGRHLHALFLNLVSSCDRHLGDTLHDSHSDKAFTLSPLQAVGNRGETSLLQYQHHHPIPAETPCWWRISLLNDHLFSQLTQLWLNLNPDRPWHLGSANLQITSILGTPQSTQPWANACTYAQLYEQAQEDRIIPFLYTTPTAFRQGKYDTALPTSEAVFNSLLKRWNRYSGVEIDPLPLHSIFPSFFNIHTNVVTDSRSKFIGCTGEVSYRLLGDIKPIQIKQINALADFAFYCGVGRKTTMGMGMVRRRMKDER
ncbi:MAG: CRISPR-associated endoribonuclease Cas6 [Cyanophyceae cyanobacterium]